MKLRRMRLIFCLCCCLVSGSFGCLTRQADNAQAKKRNCEYGWDDPGTCSNQEEDHNNQGDTGKITKKCGDNSVNLAHNKELKRQSGMMCKSKKSQPRCPSFSNEFGLPNIASLYFGATASVTSDTETYLPEGSKCNADWCKSAVNMILQPGLVFPGRCYRFQGTKGGILIELAQTAYLTGVTLIHVLKSEMPNNGLSRSTPKDFVLYGTNDPDDTEPLELGRYSYKLGGPRAQTFSVTPECLGSEDHKYLLVQFESNHGDPNYTSIYHIEVHGIFVCVKRQSNKDANEDKELGDDDDGKCKF